MPIIRSNKPLKYSPINPELESVIQLKIIDVRDFTESNLTVITVEDSLVNTDDSLIQLNIRQKQFTFAEIDQLQEVLIDGLDTTGLSYMEKRMILLREGLLLVTKQAPIYFSTDQDWEIYTETE